jgi:hypothetical protein
MRRIQRGSRKMGNHIQFMSVATKSTSPRRRSVFRTRTARLPAAAPRTWTSAREKPALKRNAGATRPSIHCTRVQSGPTRNSGLSSTSAWVWIITTTAMPRSQSKARTRVIHASAVTPASPRGC